MLFPTLTFAIFFLIVMPIAWHLRDHPQRWKVFVLAASYVFYGWWDWRFIGLIVVSSVGNWFFGRMISNAADDRARRTALIGGLVLNLGLLGFFKYYGFFVETLVSVLRPLGLAPTQLLIEITLPVAISFFTFCAISYLVDIYRRELEPSPLLDVSVYLAFFPHLVAGPIVRGSEMLPQLARLTRPDVVDATRAMRLISRGLIKKVVVANYLAQNICDPVFGTPSSYRSWDLIGAAIAFSVQLYADFSGYTDIAIGVALLLGIKFPENFDRPYTAASLQDFWRRWHMTLSRWLRDYLYIPLGGNRVVRWRQYLNLFLTMLLGGLWHGASWTFVIWGSLHGVGLSVEHWRRERRTVPHPVRAAPLEKLRTGLGLETSHGEVPVVQPDGTVAVRDVSDLEPTAPHEMNPWLGRLLTFGFVTFAWIFFASDSVAEAWEYIAGIFTRWGSTGIITPLAVLLVVAALAAQYLPPRVGNLFEWRVSQTPPVVQALGFAVVLLVCNVLGPQGVAPFIYFQF